MTSDETLYESNVIQDSNNVAVVDEKKAKSNTAKRAAAVGASVLVGGGAAYAVANMGDSSEPTPAENTRDTGVQVVNESSDKSFDEAFNDARAHLGPGGAFRWHGGLYSTYTEGEWNNMSAEEKAAYGQHAKEIAAGTERSASTYDTVSHHTHGVAHSTHVTNVYVVNDDKHHPQPTPASDNQLKIVSEEVIEVDGKYVIRAECTYGGYKAYAYDLDGDGKYDGLIVDHDGNGVDENDPVYDLTGESIHVKNQNLLVQIHNPTPSPSDDVVVQVNQEEVVEVNGKTVIAGSGTVGGKGAMFVDANMDGKYDVAIVDTNGNGQLDDGDQRVDLRGQNINVHNSGLLAQRDPAMDEPSITDANLDGTDNMPDYSPDAV